MISLLDLPSELLLETLKNCEFRSLLSVSETCKQFNELVFENSCLIHRIPLLLDSYTESRNLKILMESKRAYSNVLIELNVFPSNLHIPILQKFGENVKLLKISDVNEIGLDDFAKILNCCPNLETLKVEFTRNITANDGDYLKNLPKPKLDKLKDLNVMVSDFKVFKILMGAQLTNLDLEFDECNHFANPDFIKFFQAQKELESFTVENINRKNSTARRHDFSENFKSQLKKIDLFNYETFNVNVSKFLKGQISLEEAIIVRMKSLSVADYDHLLTKNPKLEKLTLDIHHYVSNDRQCTSVKNLELKNVTEDNYRYDEEGAEIYNIDNLITEFPNVEVLKLDWLPYLDRQTFKLIADTMVNLAELTIIGCPKWVSFGAIKFPSLKSLHLSSTFDLTGRSLKPLLENNKQITHLGIACGKKLLTDSTIQLIVDNLKDLESLNIYGYHNLSKNVFRMIAENLQTLKVFELKVFNKKFTKYDLAPLKSIPCLKVFTNITDDDDGSPSPKKRKC